jgi:hypothetical protein
MVTEAVPEYSPSTFFLQELSKSEDKIVIEKISEYRDVSEIQIELNR